MSRQGAQVRVRVGVVLQTKFRPKGEETAADADRPGKATPWSRSTGESTATSSSNNGLPIAKRLITPFHRALCDFRVGVLLLPPPHLVLPPHTKSSPRQARCLVRALGHRNPGSHRLQPALQRAQCLPHTPEVPAAARPQKALECDRPDFFQLHTPIYSWQCFGDRTTTHKHLRHGRQHRAASATGEEIPPHARPSG